MRATPGDAPATVPSVSDLAAEVTDLLQHLIRNACVNDGSRGSGNEVRSANLLADYFDGSGVDTERYEPAPGRTSSFAAISRFLASCAWSSVMPGRSQ